MRIDIATTATWRPELLEETLDSFFTNLFSSLNAEYRMVINVDPVGSDEDQCGEIKKVVSKYFKSFKINRTNKPSFPKAFRTVWSLCNAPLVFNLEEDWVLNYKLDFPKILEIMENNVSLAHLRLSAFRSTEGHIKCWNHFFPWNGEFFECKREDIGSVGWCGHPSLNRISFVKGALGRIDPNFNPEKQIKGRFMGDFLIKWRFGIYSHQNHPALIKDIGRPWMAKNKWRKAGGNDQHFTMWEKV